MSIIRQHLTAFLSSRRAAGLSGYAIILGLVAILAIGSVLTFGQQVREIFSGAEESIAEPGSLPPGGDPTEPGTAPAFTLAVSQPTVGISQTATFTWTTTGATQVSAIYTLSGACDEVAENGAFPVNVGASLALSGSMDLAWSAARAGCSFELMMKAINAHGENGGTATVAIGALDTTPENLAFADVNDVEPSALVESAAVIVDNIDGPTTITVTTPDAGVALADGDFSLSQQVDSGQSVKLRANAAAGFQQQRAIHFEAGGLSGTWNIGTRAEIVDPAQFALAAVAPQDPGVNVMTSTTAPLSGFDGAQMVITTNGADVSKDLATWRETGQLAVSAGDTLYVRMVSSSVIDGTGVVSTTVSIGSTSANWSVQTKNLVPGAIAFTNVSGINPSASVNSNQVQLSGFQGALTATCSANCTGILKNGQPAVAGVTQFTTSDTIAITMTASPTFGAAKTATVTVGTTTSAPWQVTTRAQDTAPNAIAFVTQTGVELNTLITSNAVVLSNFDGPVTATCGAGCIGILKNGSAAVQGSTPFNPGDTIAIQMTSSGSFNTPKTASVTVGTTVSSAWSVTTRAQDTVATLTPADFTDAAGQNPGTAVTSNAVSLSAFDAPLTVSCGANCTGIIKSGVASGTSTTFTPGQTLAITATASASFSGSVTAVVNIGSVSANWTITTRAMDTTPSLSPADFTNVTGRDLSVAVVSNAITLSGFDGTITITCSTNCTGIRKNGTIVVGAGGSASYSAGDTVAVRMTTSGAYSTNKTAVISIQNYGNVNWTATTKADSSSGGGGHENCGNC